MELLDQSEYDKVVEPLRYVTINNLFARSVVEKKVTGCVYVDNLEAPKTFYVVHPYGMSLLFGEIGNDKFNSHFLKYALNMKKIRTRPEWLQVFPELWNEKLRILFGDNLIKSEDALDENLGNQIIENTRVNFKFNKKKIHGF